MFYNYRIKFYIQSFVFRLTLQRGNFYSRKLKNILRKSILCITMNKLWSLKLLVTFFLLSALTASAREKMSLNSIDGRKWQLFSADQLLAADIRAAREKWQPKESIDGIVPGTVFAAYVAAGKEEEPSYADNIYNIDETPYNIAHWYRTSFDRPMQAEGKRTILTFEGVNRSAVVYFNGVKLGTIKGHVLKVRYDVTDLMKDTGNFIAVKILMMQKEFLPRTSNFVNYTCPTYVASHSWDWMPYVPGLNTGITNDVYLEFTGNATLRDPWIRSVLSNNYTEAAIKPQTSLVNLTQTPMNVQVRATIMPGNLSVTKDVTLVAGDSIDVFMPDVKVKNPLLWWPNGYGEQNLYRCRYDVISDGRIIDSQTQNFGIREYKYKKENTAFVIYLNGKKIYCKGGNWGMTEFMLRQKKSEYDLRLKLHRDMHLNMIRCWTGCVTDEEFYDACDKYGVMVWDDFWLTGPDDKTEFLSNARDKVIRLRNHPCMAVWCADNEGWPYDELNNALRDIVKEYDGAERIYMPNSHNGYYTNNAYLSKDGTGWGLSGSGWWKSFWPEDYFDDGIWGGGGDKGDAVDWGFRSELGSGAFDTYESMLEFTPEGKMWPRNDIWDKHFFSDDAAQGGGADATDYFSKVQTEFGVSTGAEQFCERAQLFNIECSKALFEGWNYNLWNTATGLLYWMSQPAYPSHLWQTYDYYYDMTGIYWGAKKACEPTHIQWNCHNGDITIVNTTHKSLSGLKAEVEVYKLNGTKYAEASGLYDNLTVAENANLNFCNMNTLDAVRSSRLSSVASMVFFLRMKLYDAGGKLISQNTYWGNRTPAKHVYTSLNSIPEAGVTCEVLAKKVDEDGQCRIKARLHNPASTVAFAVRMRLTDQNGKRILPVIMNENYVTIMPGESEDIDIEFDSVLCNGDTKILLKQYNYAEAVGAVADGIETVWSVASDRQHEAVYNLAGQRVEGNYKGIVIRKGKKTLNK